MRARSKYGNRRTALDGITFDSAAEARRYAVLKLSERAGLIRELERQPEFPIVIKGKPCFVYRADFGYLENGLRVIEDVKGHQTAEFRLKRKCVEAEYGIEIRLVRP